MDVMVNHVVEVDVHGSIAIAPVPGDE